MECPCCVINLGSKTPISPLYGVVSKSGTLFFHRGFDFLGILISHDLPRLTRALWHRAWRRRRAFLYHPMLLPIVIFLGVSGGNYLALGRLCAGCAGDGWGLHTRA